MAEKKFKRVGWVIKGKHYYPEHPTMLYITEELANHRLKCKQEWNPNLSIIPLYVEVSP